LGHLLNHQEKQKRIIREGTRRKPIRRFIGDFPSLMTDPRVTDWLNRSPSIFFLRQTY
jgi:hypothetical protein